MSIQKFEVCKHCLSVGLQHPDCICAYSHNYKTIELEYEVCDCCGHLIQDGQPAETPFNDKQFENFKNETK